MSNEIECAFQGRIGNEPVQRMTKSGKPWLSFSVLVGADDAAQWLQVALFGDSVSDLAPRLKKGERVYVEGTVRLDKWTTHDGTERQGLKVSSFKAVAIGQIGERRPKSNKSGGHAQNSRREAMSDFARPISQTTPQIDTSIPF
jgi:single-stranded DNA-binding protein